MVAGMDDQQIRERERLRQHPEQLQEAIRAARAARLGGGAAAAPRILFGVFGAVFFGAGLCMLGLIWSEESSFVPVFARLFGSLICMAFLTFGGFMVYGAFTTPKLTDAIDLSATAAAGAGSESPTAAPGNYVCPNC